ncbi:MAG: hypothetical protein AAFZ74_01885 [Pseudomonadota bacterium]
MSKKVWTWAPSLLCFLIVLGFSCAFHYRAPFHDHWDIVPLFAAMQSGEFRIGDLFALHGNHWHASAYTVMLGLSPFTGMAHGFEAFASVLFAGLGFVALIRILTVSMHQLEVPSASAWAIGFCGFFFFSLDQAANWLWGWQVAVFINLAGALWALERLTVGLPTLRNTILAAIATAISVYAFGTGWMLIPIGFALLVSFGAFQTPKGWGALGIWTVLSALLLCHFTLALNDPAAAYSTSSLPEKLALETWVGLAHYTINFIASPIVRFARDSAPLVALIGFGLLFWAIWALRTIERRNRTRGIAPFLAMAAYAIGSGLLTAIGRWEMFGVKQAFVSRYISFGTLFWIAIFVLVVFAIAKTRPQRHRTVLALMGLLFVLKLGNIPSVVQKTVGISQQIETSVETLRQTYPNTAPATFGVLHHPAQNIEPRLQELYAYRASLFSNLEAPAELPEDEPIVSDPEAP